VIDALVDEPALECRMLQLKGSAVRRPANLPFVLRLLQRSGDLEADPFAPVPLAELASTWIRPIPNADGAGHLSTVARQGIEDGRFDVVVWLGDAPLEGEAAGLGGLGIWTFRFGGPDRPLVQPYYWREIVDRAPVSTIVLQRHGERFDESEIIAEDSVGTRASWRFVSNAAGPMALAAPLLMHALLDAAGDEQRFLSRLGPAKHASVHVGRPSPLDVARFVGDRLRHSVRARVLGNPTAGREDWVTTIRKKPTPADRDVTARAFRSVPAAAQAQYADPFLCEHEGRHWLFMEEIPAYGERARLVCAEVRDDMSVAKKSVILERPYHLSYPCIFRHGDRFYMIPESGEDNTVQLHSARNFPFEWELEAVLCEGFPLRDTTPFLHDGIWYFFTTLQENHTETFLFTSDRLGGPWRYHPCNPICSGSSRSRGAGHLFYDGGRLIRPSQDSSVRYGYAIVYNEILRMTPTEYEERPVKTIRPEGRPGVLGTHTINRDGTYEVVDESCAVDLRG
jgi:hypothetical protein